jgi:hypothetical protein
MVNNMAGVERKNINRTTLALLASFLQDVLPVRVEGVRILNQPWGFLLGLGAGVALPAH